MFQYYEDAGQFTWQGKLRQSLIDNLVLYAIFLVGGLLLIVYIIA